MVVFFEAFFGLTICLESCSKFLVIFNNFRLSLAPFRIELLVVFMEEFLNSFKLKNLVYYHKELCCYFEKFDQWVDNYNDYQSKQVESKQLESKDLDLDLDSKQVESKDLDLEKECQLIEKYVDEIQNYRCALEAIHLSSNNLKVKYLIDNWDEITQKYENVGNYSTWTD